jgi:hypothetical protein
MQYKCRSDNRLTYDAQNMNLVTVKTKNVLPLYTEQAKYFMNLHINNQQDAPSIQNFILSRNSTCFGRLLWPSSGVISCTRGNWYVSCRFCGRWPQNQHVTYQLPRVQLITPDDGHGRCPKHEEFRDKIKFWILHASC